MIFVSASVPLLIYGSSVPKVLNCCVTVSSHEIKYYVTFMETINTFWNIEANFTSYILKITWKLNRTGDFSPYFSHQINRYWLRCVHYLSCLLTKWTINHKKTAQAFTFWIAIFTVAYTVLNSLIYTCRSRWPSGLRHELSSPAQTLGSWVRIQLEAWMSVYVYSVFVLSCVCR
jgi:hypothetical protein